MSFRISVLAAIELFPLVPPSSSEDPATGTPKTLLSRLGLLADIRLVPYLYFLYFLEGEANLLGQVVLAETKKC